MFTPMVPQIISKPFGWKLIIIFKVFAASDIIILISVFLIIILISVLLLLLTLMILIINLIRFIMKTRKERVVEFMSNIDNLSVAKLRVACYYNLKI